MNKYPSICQNQLALMIAGSALMFPYSFLPVLRTGPANQDAWIVMLCSIVFIIALNAPFLILKNKFLNFDFVEMNEAILGKIGGKFVSLIYTFFAFCCYTACMLIATMYTRIYLLVETPQWIVLLFVIIPAMYIATSGAGTIARLATFIEPYILLTIFVFCVVGINNMELFNILPILKDSKPMDIVEGAFFTAARFSEILILVVFSIYLRRGHSLNKSYFRSLAVFGVSFFIIVISTILLLSSGVAKLMHAPFYVYSRQVGGEDLLQRLQVFNALAWIMGSILKLSIYSYMASFFLYKVTNFKSQKFFVYPLSLLAFVVNMLPFMQRSATLDLFKQDTTYPLFVLFIAFIVPLLLLIVYLIRQKSIKPIIDQRNQAVADAEAKHDAAVQPKPGNAPKNSGQNSNEANIPQAPPPGDSPQQA